MSFRAFRRPSSQVAEVGVGSRRGLLCGGMSRPLTEYTNEELLEAVRASARHVGDPYDDILAEMNRRVLTIEAKVKALKGTRIGVATVGGGPAQYGRYLLQAYGLDPKSDATFLPVGQAATRLAALREDRTDVFIGAPPEAEIAEADGYGTLFINLATEVPLFRDYAFTVIITSKDFLTKNEDAVRRFVRTLAAANRSIHTDFADATAALQEALRTSFASVSQALSALAAADLNTSITLFGQQTTKEGAVLMVVLDQHEHLGQSIAYARTNGIVPPWSK